MTLTSETRLGFLGAGHLATALARGLLAAGHSPRRICIAAPGDTNRSRLKAEFGIRSFDDNAKLLPCAEICLLLVRPDQVEAALAPVRADWGDKPLISAVAGLSCATLKQLLPEAPILRVMPNLGVARRCGFTALCAAEGADDTVRQLAEELFALLGETAWVDESLLDATTALAGSGPGLAFHFAAALESGGVALGLEPAQARAMVLSVLQTCAELLGEDDDATAWRDRVASRGGTTEAALQRLDQGGLQDLVQRSLAAARDRAGQLGRGKEHKDGDG